MEMIPQNSAQSIGGGFHAPISLALVGGELEIHALVILLVSRPKTSTGGLLLKGFPRGDLSAPCHLSPDATHRSSLRYRKIKYIIQGFQTFWKREGSGRLTCKRKWMSHFTEGDKF